MSIEPSRDIIANAQALAAARPDDPDAKVAYGKLARAPIICRGTDTQRPCLHYKPGTFGADCTHPKNMQVSLVEGKPTPTYQPSHLRAQAHHCGPAGAWYAPDQPF